MVSAKKMLPLAFIVAACSGTEVTGVASSPMTLTFEPAERSVVGTRLANGTFRCPIDMTIIAHGKSDHRVALQSIASTFYDSAGAKANTVTSLASDWFGVTTLKRDSLAVAHREPTGSGPFKLTSELTYVDQFGTSKVAMFTLTCAR